MKAVPLERYSVPTAPFLKLATRYIQEQNMDMVALSERCGLERCTLGQIFNREKMRFDTADKIMVNTYGPMMWHNPGFIEIYWQGEVPPDAAKPVKCKNVTCEEWFALPEEDGPARTGVWKQKYCSQRCRQQVWDRKQNGSFSRECVGCGEVFNVSPPPPEKRTHGGWARRQYCTKTCQNQVKWQRQKAAS